ncbi:hypothetical protein WICPIJ_000788 [Wickerhamomyces pijperi]|uniref:Uncharacterized protein n=1 Tax=Wickerhamomyces pijperi TaxID=599730 RepID=A0A9P8QCV9_WICPI|nr:hypothetical protein WICPIJ_000788 [Wickerhamomyces pijperi]
MLIAIIPNANQIKEKTPEKTEELDEVGESIPKITENIKMKTRGPHKSQSNFFKSESSMVWLISDSKLASICS